MERPALTFDLKFGNETKTVKMTYGLFMDLLKVIPSPENIGEVLITEPDLKDFIVRRSLSGNKKIIKEEDLIDPFEMDVDFDEINALVTWIADHVIYFFMNSAQQTKTMAQKYEKPLKEMKAQLDQSNSGSAD